MPKKNRRRQNQNAVTNPTAADSIAPDLLASEPLAGDSPTNESFEQEGVLVNSNGDAAVLTPAPVLVLPPEPIAEAVVNSPTLRSLSNLVTFEVLAFVVLGIAALWLRVANLDARPLSPSEAQTAAAAFEFLNGKTVGAYTSPLLFTLNWLSFLLLGAFDLTARFLPAVLSTLLVFVPLLARKVLGKTGAFVAALLIAVSPTVLFFGRAVAGADLAVGGALAALILFYQYRESQKNRTLYFAAALAALSLTADAAAFTILIAGGIYFAITFAMTRRDATDNPTDDTLTTANALKNPLVRATIFFVVVYVLAATTFLLNRDGLGVAFNLFGEWANGYATVGDFATPLSALIVYEPLSLIFGLAGLVLVATTRGAEGQNLGLLRLVGLVAFIALLFYSLAGNKEPPVIVAITVPIAMIAGWFIGNLLERAREDIQLTGGWASVKAGELPVFVMLMVLAALIYLQIVTFLQQTKFSSALDAIYQVFSGTPGNVSLTAAALALALILVLLLGVFIGLSILLVGMARTVTLLAFVILFLLALGGLRATWLLNFSNDEPLHELVASAQTPLQIRDMVQDIEFLSQARNGDSHVIKIAADPSLGAVGQWYLRVFPNLSWTSQLDTLTKAQAIVTPSNTPPPGNWMGQHYRVSVDWKPTNLDGMALWKWYVFRDVGNTDSGAENWQTVMLWLPTETK